MPADYITRTEFYKAFADFKESIMNEIHKEMRNQTEELRGMFFDVLRFENVELTRQYGALLEDAKDDTKRVSEGLSLVFEMIERYKLENEEAHKKLGSRLSFAEAH